MITLSATKKRSYGLHTLSHSSKGQVSTEILFSVIVLLMLFVVVLLFIEQTRQQSDRSHQNVNEQEACVKLSSIITYMTSNPPYTETSFELQEDVNIANGNIFVGDIFCPYLGKASNVQLYAGIIRGFDINGVVVFTNDLNYSPFVPYITPPSEGDVTEEGVILLIDDEGNSWVDEVLADDTSYAVSFDDALYDPDWVEFRFPSLGLTSGNVITDVTVLIKHFESNLSGLSDSKNMFQCSADGATWVNVEPYTPSFTELFYLSPSLTSCFSDWNSANHVRVRMTYEPNGTGSTISLDYARVDVNFTQVGFPLDLWENALDLPQPIDFKTDINSLANTFGPSTGNDGWDWEEFTYGGNSPQSVYFNADPNLDGSISDSVVPSTKRLEIKLGGGVPGAVVDPDDSLTTGPVTSGAYGVQFDINSELWSLIQGGYTLNMSFTYTVDADAGWGNALDSGEEGWIKARFGNDSVMNYLGTDLDTPDTDADATPEIWWADHPVDDTGFYTQDVTSWVTGPGTYYFDVGAALSDWESTTEGLGVYIDNINGVIIP